MMDRILGKGMFLVATPALRDPNFRQSVILLCEHGPDGALGIVINRPTEIHITEILPEVPVLEGQRHLIYAGGPVQQNHVLILYQVTEEPQDTHHVFDSVYLGGNMDMLKQILTEPTSQNNFRAFIGYSGWAPEQLENEMKVGSWLTIPANSTSMFNQDAPRLWSEILRSLGHSYDIYADMPIDPNMN